MSRFAPTAYAISPMEPFPRYWHDHVGNLRVLGGPHDGWLLMRRPGAMPFALRVAHVLNARSHHIHGPFRLGKAPKVAP